MDGCAILRWQTYICQGCAGLAAGALGVMVARGGGSPCASDACVTCCVSSASLDVTLDEYIACARRRHVSGIPPT